MSMNNRIMARPREGMSIDMSYTEAALMLDGSVMLLSASCVTRNEMPSGFIRLLTDIERHHRGIILMRDLHLLDSDRKRNSCRTSESHCAV